MVPPASGQRGFGVFLSWPGGGVSTGRQSSGKSGSQLGSGGGVSFGAIGHLAVGANGAPHDRPNGANELL
jgi:hypothetical protein